jgi:hypothetical protein
LLISLKSWRSSIGCPDGTSSAARDHVLASSVRLCAGSPGRSADRGNPNRASDWIAASRSPLAKTITATGSTAPRLPE